MSTSPARSDTPTRDSQSPSPVEGEILLPVSLQMQSENENMEFDNGFQHSFGPASRPGSPEYELELDNLNRYIMLRPAAQEFVREVLRAGARSAREVLAETELFEATANYQTSMDELARRHEETVLRLEDLMRELTNIMQAVNCVLMKNRVTETEALRVQQELERVLDEDRLANTNLIGFPPEAQALVADMASIAAEMRTATKILDNLALEKRSITRRIQALEDDLQRQRLLRLGLRPVDRPSTNGNGSFEVSDESGEQADGTEEEFDDLYESSDEVDGESDSTVEE